MASDVWERAVMAGLNTFSDAIPGNIRYREQIYVDSIQLRTQ